MRFGRAGTALASKAIIATVLCLMPLGCSTVLTPPYQPQAGTVTHVSEIDGLRLTAIPLTKEEVAQSFGRDLLEEEILPVFLIAENRTAASSFSVTPERASLGDFSVGGDLLPSYSRFARLGGAGAAGLTPLLLAGPIGLGVLIVTAPVLYTAGSKASSDASQVRYNFVKSRLGARTLVPNERVEGFLYFALPEDASSWLLRVEVWNATRAEWQQHEISIHESPGTSQ